MRHALIPSDALPLGGDSEPGTTGSKSLITGFDIYVAEMREINACENACMTSQTA